MFPDASRQLTVTVYTRPFPSPERSARSKSVDPLVTIQSGAVSPSPRPFTGSLLETDEIEHTGVPQLSVALQLTDTGTNLWLGGQSTFGLADTELMLGGVTSGDEHVDDVANASVV